MNKIKKLEKLKTIQKAIKAMLPGVSKIPCDISLINNALIYIDELIMEEDNDS